MSDQKNDEMAELSAEDQEIINQLDLIENMDVLENLDELETMNESEDLQ